MGRLHYPTGWVRLTLVLNEFGQEDADREIVIEYPPIRYSVVKNAFNVADTATLLMDLEDFPFDPRIIRGATIEIYQADSGALDPNFWHNATREDIIAKHGLFIGVVDVVKTTFDQDWRATEFKCRDYTAYFLDVKIETNPISYIEGTGTSERKLTFLEVIERIVQQEDRPQTHAIQVVQDDDVGDVYPADYKLRAKDVTLGKRRKREGETVWEVMTELALEAGLVIYVDLDKIRIRRPRTIFLDQAQDESAFYRWTLGENLTKLVGRRNMGRQHGINVYVFSYSPDTNGGEPLKAFAPADAMESQKTEIPATEMGGKGEAKKARRVVFRPFVVRGVTSQTQLDLIAEALYTLLQHHELEGEFSTDDMVDSMDASNNRVRYGDPVVFDVSGRLASIVALDRPEQVRRLLELGYEPQVAEDIALSLKAPRVPYYVHKATHTFTSEDGGGYDFAVEVRSRKEIDLTPAAAE